MILNIKKFFKSLSSKGIKRYSFFSITTFLLIIVILFTYIFIVMRSSTINNQESTEIYFASDLSYTHEYLINKFNKINEGKIKVIPIDLSYKQFSTNDRKEILIRTLRSKSSKLDVFAVDQIWVPRFTKWAEPLDNYINDKTKSDLLEDALITCLYENKLYAIPLYLDIGVMFFREDLLKTFPHYEEIKQSLDKSITWEDFIKLNNNSRVKPNLPFYIFPAYEYEGLVCSFIELILSQNKNYFNSSQLNFETQEAKKSLSLLVDLVNRYKISPYEVTELTENTAYKYCIENDGLFLRGWPSFQKDYKNLYKNTKKDSLLVMTALPHFKDAEPTAIFGGWNLMVSKYSLKKEAVLTFINFLISEESQKTLYEKGAYLPVLKSIYDNEEFIQNHPQFKFEKKLVQMGVHRPFLEDYTRISDILSYYINQAIKNEITVTEALSEANQLIQSHKILIK
ncbi:MAG: ABC transporter substrate-binding protein [Ignavibacterium sp.]